MRSESLSFIVPVYNEASLLECAIPRTIQALEKDFQRFEVIIVNDGSRNETGDVCARFAQSDARIRVLSNDINLNVGIGLQRGLTNARMDYVTHSAVDLPLGPESVAELMDRAAACDILVLQRESYAGYVGWRVFTSWSNRLLLGTLFPHAGAGITDFNFTQIYRRSIIERILPLARSPSFTTPEMILRARCQGMRVRASSVRYEPRTQGRGAFGRPHDMIWSLYDMLRFRIRLWARVEQRMASRRI